MVVEEERPVRPAGKLSQDGRRGAGLPDDLGPDAGGVEQVTHRAGGLLQPASLGGDAGMPDEPVEKGKVIGQMGGDVRLDGLHEDHTKSSGRPRRTHPHG